jgi:hypothetical protein
MSQRSGIPAIGDCLDLLRAITFAPGPAGDIVKRLVGLGLSRDDMLETLVDTAFPSWEGAKNMDTKLKGAITREWRKMYSDKGEEAKRSNKDGVEDEDYVSDMDESVIGLID